MDLFLYGILSLFTGGVLALLLPEKWKIRALILFSFIGLALVLLPAIIVLFSNRELVLGQGMFRLRIDSQAAFFQITIIWVFFFTVIYTAGCLKRRKAPSDFSFPLFFMTLFAICLLVLTAVSNAAAFLLAWQAMILALFFASLPSARGKDGVRDAFKRLFFLEGGFACVLGAVIILCVCSGGTELDLIGINEGAALWSDAALALLFAGFSLNAGWLPRSRSNIFPPLNSLQGSLLCLAGIFGFVRILNGVPAAGTLLVAAVLALSAAVAVWGAVRASRERELFSFLSRSGASYYGMAGMGIGVGLAGLLLGNNLMSALGFASALFQAANHAIAKSLAYYAVGDAFPGAWEIPQEKLRGMIGKNISASLFLITALLALAGIPLFNGFISAFLVSSSVVSVTGNGLLAAFLVPALVTGVLLPMFVMLPAYARIIVNMASGQDGKTKVRRPKQKGRSLTGFASAAMALLVMITGIFPQFAALLTVNPSSDLARIGRVFTDHTVLTVFSREFNSLNMISKTLLTFLGMALILYLIRVFALTKKEFESSARKAGPRGKRG